MSELTTPFKIRWKNDNDVYTVEDNGEISYWISWEDGGSSYDKESIRKQIEEGVVFIVEDYPVSTPEATPDVTTEGDKSKWTAAHYDNYYQLTEADIKAGKVKIDAYFVNKMWKLNQKDDTGGLFHSLKTIARFGEKNTIERELKALYNQTKRMAELYGVEL